MMKGRTRTTKEKQYQDLLCTEIGCVVCWLHENKYNNYCSIHHIDGRTKPDSHLLVLPLCDRHHQTEQPGDYEKGIYALHTYKSKFESVYGREIVLKIKCDLRLEDMGFEVPKLTDDKNKYVRDYSHFLEAITLSMLEAHEGDCV